MILWLFDLLWFLVRYVVLIIRVALAAIVGFLGAKLTRIGLSLLWIVAALSMPPAYGAYAPPSPAVVILGVALIMAVSVACQKTTPWLWPGGLPQFTRRDPYPVVRAILKPKTIQARGAGYLSMVAMLPEALRKMILEGSDTLFQEQKSGR